MVLIAIVKIESIPDIPMVKMDSIANRMNDIAAKLAQKDDANLIIY